MCPADQAPTREHLYALAAEREISGRSSMTKAELRDAVQEHDGDDQLRRPVSRVDDFRRLAEARARGAAALLPRMLTGEDRRQHVRQTLREDHQSRIARGDEDAQAKFDKLAGSLFSFFRGTALLFYRDMPGEDPWMPTVLAMGDIHPENFGVMPNADNVAIFGVNDFDEANYAPFTWDLKRGATGFMIAADEIAGYGPKRQAKIARRFVEGYVAAMRRFADDGDEREQAMRLDNAPPLIRTLIADGLEESREAWLEDYLDERRGGFRSKEDLIPVTGRRDTFQQALERLVETNGIEPPERAGELHVKDVAIRRGAGTASLGLDRYYLLVEGPGRDGTDDLIIEFKQARTSALAGLVPPSDYEVEPRGGRIAHAQHVQLVRGDRFFGSVELDGVSFMTRERAPYRDDIDLEDLSKGEWRAYADTCGRIVAHAHAMSDELGQLDHDIEPMIVDAMAPAELFVEDVVRYAREAANRLRRDHELFRADHRLGAFTSIDIAYS